MENGGEIHFGPMKTAQSSGWEDVIKRYLGRLQGYLLVHNDTYGIVQQTLPKDDSVQFRVDLVLIENGKDSDGVRGR